MGKEHITGKRVDGGTKKRRSKHTRKIRAKNSTVYTRKPTKPPREQ